MNLQSKPKRQDDIQSTLLADGYIALYSERTELACTVTPIGAIVWEFCDGEHTVTDILAELHNIDEISKVAPLQDELVRLLDDLADSGLIKV